MREGLCLLLAGQEGFRVVGETGTSHEVVPLALQEQPDVILLDLVLYGSDSLALIGPLCKAVPSAKIIVLTAIVAEEKLRQAIMAGARGIVNRREPSSVLLKAIKCVEAGEWWVERSLLTQVMLELIQQQGSNIPASPGSGSCYRHPGDTASLDGSQSPVSSFVTAIETSALEQITARERDIILLVGRGFANKQIATQLRLSERTIHSHLASVFHKLDVATRLELALLAHRCGWLAPPP